MSTNEGKCVLVEVGALISWCIYSYRILMILVPYMWASITFLPKFATQILLKVRVAKMMNLFSKRSLRQYNKGSVISPPYHVVLPHPVKVRACKTDRDKQKNTVCRGKSGFPHSWVLIVVIFLIKKN